MNLLVIEAEAYDMLVGQVACLADEVAALKKLFMPSQEA